MTELLGIQLHPFPPLRGNRQYHVQCILQVRQTPSISLHLQDLRRPPLQYQWLWKALHLWPLWSSCLPAKWAPQVLPSSPWAPPNPHEIPVLPSPLAKVNPSIDPGTCRNFPSDGFLLCGKKPNVEGKKSKRVTDLKKTKWSKMCTLCVFWCGFWMFLGVFASVVCLACAIVMLIQP